MGCRRAGPSTSHEMTPEPARREGSAVCCDIGCRLVQRLDSGADPAAGSVLGGREVTVAVENAYLPFNYLDPETGEPTGWDYEVIDEICRRLDCVPVYEDFPWEPMIQAVADGRFDMAADGITITPERAEIVDFSEGYINVDHGCWSVSTRLGSPTRTSSRRAASCWAPRSSPPTTTPASSSWAPTGSRPTRSSASWCSR